MSNETPRQSLKKTKSAPKYFFASLFCIVLLGLGLWFVHGRQKNLPADALDLRIGRMQYRLEIAASESAKEQGLGGRVVMDESRGMIFPYQNSAERCFWMKDMHFPLDIIWVDSSKKVVHIASNTSPGTYPKTYCYNGKYVIELDAGEASKNHLQAGQSLSF